MLFYRTRNENKVDPLGFEPRAFRMQSERDTTTPRAHNALELAKKMRTFVRR